MENKIQDRSNDRMYFTQTPMVVWAHCNDVYEYALWNTIKMIAGEAGECYLNTNDLAALSMMSVGKVAACRESLIANGLIEGEKRIHDGQQLPVWHLRIPDLWPLNIDVAGKYPKLKDKVSYKENQRRGFSCGEKPSTPHEKPSTPHEKPSTPHEKPSTPHERKNIYNKNQNDNQGKNQGGDQRVQDLPSPAEPQTPPPTALPVKVDEPTRAQPVQQQQAKHVAKTGDPMMDAAIAKHNGESTKQVKIAVDGIASRYRERGLTDVQFRGMVDAYLDEKCQLDIANGEGSYADRALSTAQEFIDALMGKGKRFWSLDAIRLLFRSWEANNKGMKDPSPMQLLTHAEQIVKGKVEKKVFANGVPAQSTRDADEKADADFWRAGGTLVDIGPKYQVTERKLKPGTGRMDPKTCKYIEEVYLDEEPAVETQKAA